MNKALKRSLSPFVGDARAIYLVKRRELHRTASLNPARCGITDAYIRDEGEVHAIFNLSGGINWEKIKSAS